MECQAKPSIMITVEDMLGMMFIIETDLAYYCHFQVLIFESCHGLLVAVHSMPGYYLFDTIHFHSVCIVWY